MRSLLYFALFLSIAAFTYGQENSYRVSNGGGFERRDQNGHLVQLFPIPTPLSELREVVPSPSGKVAYLEIVNPSTPSVPYSQSAEQVWEKPYDPERLAQQLHVCTLKGEELQTIDIKMKDTMSANYLRFLGESYVGLTFASRRR
ncbi:MAG TPA: hypothetical protein PLA90_11440 [Candidatus Sumerlaeota bacterium]|nr:hypothetical protein [Candidatus Sumerlaeota bacterium]HPS02146.1 hypothetical protein [Candidatus Sumerlaeota bacterium]